MIETHVFGYCKKRPCQLNKLPTVKGISSGCINYGFDFSPPPSDGFSYYFVPILLFPKKGEMVLEQMKVFKKQKRWFWERITSGKPKGG